MSENIPAAPIPTRLDAFQDTQVPPTASLDMMSNYPTMYPIPGLSRPPLAPFPNASLHAPPSFSANLYSAGGPSFVPNCHGQGTFSSENALFPPDLYGAGGSSFVSDYQDQGTIFPPADASFFPDMHAAGGPSFAPNYQGQGVISPPSNLPPPMFPTNDVYFEQSLHPFSGISSDATTGFLPSESGSHHELEQPAPLTYQWPLPIEPEAAVTQAQTLDRVAQDPFVMNHFQGSGSLDGWNYQGTVAFQTTPPAPEVHPAHQQRNHPRFQPPEEAKIKKKKRKVRTCTNVHGQKLYFCELCDKWVLVHRKKYHDRKHAPETGEFVCKICEIAGKRCELSRKDALKRHVDTKHFEYAVLLKNLDLNILVPRKRDEYEDLGELKRAMDSLKAQRALAKQ